jgi:hypothetical protein
MAQPKSANWELMDDEEIERCYRSNVSGRPGPGIYDLIADGHLEKVAVTGDRGQHWSERK